MVYRSIAGFRGFIILIYYRLSLRLVWFKKEILIWFNEAALYSSKMTAAQLFETSLIMRNDSWVPNQYIYTTERFLKSGVLTAKKNIFAITGINYIIKNFVLLYLIFIERWTKSIVNKIGGKNKVAY